MSKTNLTPICIICVWVFLISSCEKETSSSVSINTIITNTFASPIIIGGEVIVNGPDEIIEKGIIIGTNSNLTIDDVYDNLDYSPSPTYLINLHKGGWRLPSNKTITIKSFPGEGAFNLTIQGTMGNTTYFTKAYAKSGNKIYYGKTESFKTANHFREVRAWDYANVFWKSNYTLYDLLTDEIIQPDLNGNYFIWYTSNENPKVFSTTKTASSLPFFLFYKFKSQENCQRWCDLKTGALIPQN